MKDGKCIQKILDGRNAGQKKNVVTKSVGTKSVATKIASTECCMRNM